MGEKIVKSFNNNYKIKSGTPEVASTKASQIIWRSLKSADKFGQAVKPSARI